MTIAAKHFDPLVGVDTHIILIPSPAGPIPTPLPHPYIGMVLDPFDYVPKLGATVYVNGLPRGQAGTNGQALPPHIPMGGPFAKPPTNESEIFMGSATVLFDGEPQSFLGMPVLSCQDIGMPAPPRPKKKSVAKSLELPTTTLISIPMGALVLIGGPPTISMSAMASKAALAGLKKLAKLKAIQKAIKKTSDALHHAAEKLMKKLGLGDGARNAVHRALCSVTGHPVDVASGKLFTDGVDLELAGPIPFKWERVWYSTSTYKGPLGHGWHHSYDFSLRLEDGVILFRAADGRHIGLPHLARGESHFDAMEKITFTRDDVGYAVRTSDGLWHRFADVGVPGELSLVVISNTLGQRIQFQYDRARLTRIVDSAGRNIDVTWDNQGRIIALVAPHPSQPHQRLTVAAYEYDGWGNLASARNALGQSMTYGYNTHLLVKETNRNGLSFYFVYDGNDHNARCVRTWGDGGIYDHKITYDVAAGITIVENSLGHKTTYVHDGAMVHTTLDAYGNKRQTEYDDGYRVVAEIDELGQRTAFAYDERGNLIESVTPDGAKLTIENGPHDSPIRAVDAVGGQWSWIRDEHGRLIQRKDPLGRLTKFHYAGPLLIGVTDPNAGYTALGYDDAGNVESVTTPDGASTRYQYDLLGRRIATTDPNGNIERRDLDLLGRITQVTQADGNVRTLTYDAEGNVIHAKDRHHDVQFAYQGMGRLAQRTEAGTSVRFEYDSEEQLLAIVNEHGRVYGFKLGPTGGVLEERGFDDLLRRYTRDKAGRVTRVDRPDKRFTLYKYDAASRVTAVEHSDGSKEQYAYRKDGELMLAVAGPASVRFERDLLGRITKETQGTDWVSSEYNVLGLRTKVQSSKGLIQTIRRNKMGDVLAIEAGVHKITPTGNGNAEPQTTFQATFQRDRLGLELERTLPGGVRGRWQRDQLGRPIRHEIWVNKDFKTARQYQWDVNDRLKAIIDALKGPTQYTHDALGNLAAAVYEDGPVDLRMPDAVGNLFRTESRTDRKYGPAGQLLEAQTPKGVTRYEYDAEGNLVRKIEPAGVWTYEWNGAGMLVKVVRPDGDEVTFGYDALGRRAWKKFRNKTTKWIWDGNVPLHEWVEAALAVGNGAVKPAQVETAPEIAAAQRDAVLSAQPAQGPPIEGTRESPITWLFEPESFAPVAKLHGEQQFGIVTDHLGTPLAMYDGAGSEVWGADIDVYGDLRNLRGERRACPFRWPGQYEDAETGLYYNRWRYYDREAGRFISQDPLGIEGGPAPYLHVPDPLVWQDPNGLARRPWDLTPAMTDATRVIRGRTYYRHTTTGLWWSRDTAGHGGSAFKVFEEGSGETLTWIRDADEFGDFIDPTKKHKGPKGKKVCG